MFYDNKIWIASSGDKRVGIIPKMANRHGLIAGATGTGKTITLKVMAESFSACGVPVFLADVKGDLAGMCNPGVDSEDMQKRIAKFGLGETGFSYHGFPTCYWDIFGEKGLPLRTTITEMGATLLARLMDLNQTQSDILSIVFQIADDEGLLLIDTKDLKSMLQYVGENYKEYTTQYGNITKQSVGAIVRALTSMESEGADIFFGEPALDIHDWFTVDASGRGMINILHCASLINHPAMYSTFMLWMMSELFETMPEAGDGDKPKMVFFFDEAHLLFDSAPKALLEKIEQVVKLIRSKGIGIYFITQSPSDIPDSVLSQLGNRVQHALRAYTPADQKAVKAAAQSFRPNPEFDTMEVITQLKTAETLISFLQEDGSPSVVERSFILPPESQMGVITDEQRASLIRGHMLYAKYGTSVDRDSAYEFFQRKAKQTQEEIEKEEQEQEQERLTQEEEKNRQQEEKEQLRQAREKEREEKAKEKEREKMKKEIEKELKSTVKSTRSTSRRQSPLEKAAGSAMTSIGRELGRTLARGIMNTLKR